MKRFPQFPLYLLAILILPATLTARQSYVPEPGTEWEERTPAELGMDGEALQAAVDLALERENSVETDLRIAILRAFSREPGHHLAGPVRERGGPAGMVIKDGYLVASWGDLERVDMTFSVTKSYLSTVAGLAFDRGLIRDPDERVEPYVWDGTFDGEHNSRVTWRHLLNQTSDWSGSLFGTADWTDRPPQQGSLDDWRFRELREPGTRYQYNDVRVNLLAYSLLQVWRKPLPEVLKEEIMDPIGASTTWRWYGYDSSWVEMDGKRVQSVSGGGHHGGGLFISTLDQARFGLLYARKGVWGDQRLLSEEWIRRAVAAEAPNPGYGWMWWTLHGSTRWEGVPDHVYYAAGFGGNYIVVDDQRDLVIVLRWIDGSALGEFVSRVYGALGE